MNNWRSLTVLPSKTQEMNSKLEKCWASLRDVHNGLRPQIHVDLLAYLEGVFIDVDSTSLGQVNWEMARTALTQSTEPNDLVSPLFAKGLEAGFRKTSGCVP